METAKLFMNGKSQAVRLPKAYRMKGKKSELQKSVMPLSFIHKNQMEFFDR